MADDVRDDDQPTVADRGQPGDGPTSPEPSLPAEETLEGLRADLAKRTREAAEAQDRYLRTLAEFDNYRKRLTREREEWRRQAQDELIREILPVLDNFDRALAVDAATAADAGFRQGVELIHRDFLKALERVGVRPFDTTGEPFDPQRHEAVARVERSDVADQTVVSEISRGYLSQDRVLRPARVVVAVEPAATSRSDDAAAPPLER
jgi:molecular chaperone GrpE